MSSSTLADGIRLLRSQLAVQRCSDDSDEQLLHAFTSCRDDSAFAALVGRHGPMVMNVCRRVLGHHQDAEDAFQATFLVLARNAAKLRDTTALAGFLHGTAYRMARKAKQSAARRRKHEGALGALPQSRSPVDPVEELSWREVRVLLDEEIARLPEIYRSAFVLCHLENVSREEAARRLGVKEGTLSSRLAESYKRLAQRLGRRGVELTAVLAATAVATPPVSAVPASLMATTIKAALAIAGSEKIAGIVSASVAELVRGAAAMMASKAKIATVLLVTLTLLSGTGVCFLVSPQHQQGLPVLALRAGKQTANTPRSAKRETAKTVEVRGRVLDPEGKPKAGAKLLLLGGGEKMAELGVTAADGRFTIAVPKQAKDRSLIARTEDAGIDFLHAAHWKTGKPAELRLVKDRPIQGRIINTEGRHVAGVRVAVRLIRVYANNSLDSFAIGWAKRRGNSEMPEGVKTLWPGEAPFFTATTDAAGRFILRGIGSERVAVLNFNGPGIAITERWIVNRDGFDAKPYNQELLNYSPGKVQWGPWTWISGPDVSLIAEREKIIRGVVKDADSGKGVAGASVWLFASGTSSKRPEYYGGLLALPLKTRADAEGRYEIRGALKAKWYKLQVMKDRDAGYLGSVVRATDNMLGYQPLTVDLTVRKGVIVTGKIIDKSTGKTVPGYVETAALNGNPFPKNHPADSQEIQVSLAKTGNDDTFRVVVIPGPVLLRGTVDSTRLPGGAAEGMGYKKCQPDPKYPQYFRMRPDGNLGYFGLKGTLFVLGGNSCKVLDAKPGTAIVHQDLFVERESARIVKIQDAEGRPLSRAWATNLRPDESDPVRLKGDSCPVYSLEADKPRFMVFYEPNKRLAAWLKLTTGAEEPIAVRLRPAGAFRGRLLDTDGKPLAGVVVDVRYRDGSAGEIHRIIHKAKQSVTDANGTFSLDELIPELKFELVFRGGKRRFERETKPTEAMIQVESAECRDLGAIKLKRIPETVGE